MDKIISINLVVLNGEKYIRHCLDSILSQNYPRHLIEFNILDNGSTDNTKEIIMNYEIWNLKHKFAGFILRESKTNLGMWGGQEELLKYSGGEYIISVAVDVILDKSFIENAVEALDKNAEIGAIQPKVYRYDLRDDEPKLTNIIDTCGFKIFRSRRIINLGHGEEDMGQFNYLSGKEIFGVEGAIPIFRKKALESIKITLPEGYSEIADHDIFWYADDLDIAWHLRLAGWKEIFEPKIIAWHDRQTTKRLRKGIGDFIKIRKEIPLKKRQLEWRNIHLTILKNDYIINLLRNVVFFIPREIGMLIYLFLFEPAVLKIVPNFFRLLPRTLAKRKIILKNSAIKPNQINKWFN